MQTDITQTIFQKVPLLSEEQQKTVLEGIENLLKDSDTNVTQEATHPLELIGKIQIDSEHDDLAENHDFYAHRKLND